MPECIVALNGGEQHASIQAERLCHQSKKNHHLFQDTIPNNARSLTSIINCMEVMLMVLCIHTTRGGVWDVRHGLWGVDGEWKTGMRVSTRTTGMARSWLGTILERLLIYNSCFPSAIDSTNAYRFRDSVMKFGNGFGWHAELPQNPYYLVEFGERACL